MALLRVEAEKLSRSMLEAGVVEEIIERDPAFALIPFKQIVGKAYVYNRENTLAEGEFLDPYETVPEAASDFTEVTAKLRILAGDVDVDKFLDATMGDTNDQVAIQLAAKAKGIARKFHRTLAIGNSGTSPKEFDGYSSLVSGSQTLFAGTNGGAVSFSALDELQDAVPNGADALVMRKGTWRAIRALLRATGGAGPEHIMLPNFGQPVPAYNGMPVLLNDFLPGNEVRGSSSLTGSIYAVRFNEEDGLHGIYGGSSAGLQVETIGTIQNKDANRWRLKWYVGTCLKSTKSLARLAGVTNI
jgi:hypothetical protein